MDAQPKPLTDADLEEMEKRATAEWVDATPDVLRLIAEVRGLRAAIQQIREDLDP